MMHLLRSLMVIVMMTFATTAFALEPCGEPVVDMAGVLRDVSGVQVAAANLAKVTGAEVRVRITKDFAPETSLDAHVIEVRENVCPTWNNSQDDLRSDFILVWIATEREDIGFYYGSRWKARMRSREDASTRLNEDAVFDSMIPALLDPDNRNYDKALQDGLKQTALVLAPKPKEPPASESAPRVSTPAVEPAVKQEPVDMKPFLILIAIVIAAIVLIVAAKSIASQRAEKQTQEEKRQAAQRAAVTVFNEVGEVSVAAGNAITRTEKAIVAAEAVSSPEQIADWQGQLRELRDSVDVLRGKHNAPPTDPREEHSLSAYDDAKKAFAELLPVYELARDDLTNLAQEVEGIPALAAAMPQELEELQKDVVVSVGQLIANFQRDGFVITGPDTLFKAGEEVIRQMRGAINARDWKYASAHLAQARLKFNEAKVAAQSLPLRRDEVAKRLAMHRAQLDSFPQKKELANSSMAGMVKKFTKDCYILVVGNDTKAQQVHDELVGGLPALTQLVTTQDWDAAEQILAAVDDDWADIEDLFTAITDRLKRLDQMVVDAKAELAEAERSIVEAGKYLVDQSKYNTTENQSVVAKLQSDLNKVPQPKKGKPFPVVEQFRLATAIDDAADAFLSQIEDRVADDAARAERAKRLLEDIGGRIKEYDTYAMLHRGDIPTKVLANLKTAEEDYAILQQMENVNQQLTEGATVEKDLDAFYKSAKQAVTNAEKEREENRRAAAKRAAVARRREEENDDDDGPFGSVGGLTGISINTPRPSRANYGGSRSYGGGSSGGGGTRSFGISSGGGSRSFGGSSKMSGGGSRSFGR